MQRGNSIRRQMILTFIPLTLLSMLLMVFLSYWLFSARMEAMLKDNVDKTVDQVNRHVDTYMDEFTRLSVMPYYYPEILSVMEASGPTDRQQNEFVQNVITRAISNPREDLQGVFIFRDDGEVFWRSLYNAEIDTTQKFQTSKSYLRAFSNNGQAVFMGADNDLPILNRPKSAFSVARSIKLYNGPVLGTIIIDVNYNGLEQLFNRVDLGGKSNFVVLGDDGEIIYSKNDLYHDGIASIQDLDNVSRQLRIGKEDVIVSSQTSHVTGWKVVGIVSKTELFSTIQIVRTVLIVISVLLTVLLTLSCILIAHSITGPLRNLKRLMQEVVKGNYNVTFQTNGRNEVSEVGRVFNKMSREINDLVNQVLKVRYQQKEAELRYLKLQIRPHFLFNNLETIRALAELDERKGIIDITRALGSMLRYSIRKQDGLVPLAEEIKQIENYLLIEQIRAGDTLHVEYDIDESIHGCYIPPLILQPIVENCFHHGFRYKMSDKRILITARLEQGQIVIEVQDNGCGMDQTTIEKLERMLNKRQENEEAMSGIGLQNVHSRIALTFGAQYGLQIDSIFDEQTTLRVVLPHLMQMPVELIKERS